MKERSIRVDEETWQKLKAKKEDSGISIKRLVKEAIDRMYKPKTQ